MNLAIAIPRRELGSRAQARTKEIQRCLKLTPDVIWMMDSDQTMPVKALGSILNDDMTDIWVIDAPTKYDSSTSNIYYHPNGQLAHFTISCCFIRPRVFETMPEPWFDSSIAYCEEGTTTDGFIKWRIEPKYSDDNVGEDVYFSRKCLDLGFKITVLPYKCRHIEVEAL